MLCILSRFLAHHTFNRYTTVTARNCLGVNGTKPEYSFTNTSFTNPRMSAVQNSVALQEVRFSRNLFVSKWRELPYGCLNTSPSAQMPNPRMLCILSIVIFCGMLTFGINLGGQLGGPSW